MTKRVLAFLMVIAMVFSLIPTVVVAEDVETIPAGYTMYLQKSHNQENNSLSVDVFLQATTAEQGDVTGFQFDVVPGTESGLSWQGVDDVAGIGVQGSGTKVLADSENVTPFAVGADQMVLVATLTFAGTTENLAADLSLDNIEVTTEAGSYSNGDDGVIQPETQGYLGAVTTTVRECKGHGEDTTGWQPISEAADLTALTTGKYYLTGKLEVTEAIDLVEGAEVDLCLNGFDIECVADGDVKLFDLEAAATLNIHDCTATGKGADYEAGHLLSNAQVNWSGIIRMQENAGATVNFYDGVIDGTNKISVQGAVDVQGGNTFNMEGGKFYNIKGVTTRGAIVARNTTQAKAIVNISGATFDTCGSPMITNYDVAAADQGIDLTLNNVQTVNSLSGAQVALIEDNAFKTAVIEGDCHFDAPVYVAAGNELTLKPVATAEFSIATAEELTAEQFNELVKMAEGGALGAGLVTYATASVSLEYADGQFAFANVRTISDKYAVDALGNKLIFKPWSKTDSLPSSGNWYLENGVTVTVTKSLGADTVLNLDLNGQTVTFGDTDTTDDTVTHTRAYNVRGTVKLFDGTSQFDAEGNWIGAGQGQISGYNSTYGVIAVYAGGEFHLCSGKFTNNGQHKDYTYSGAVYLNTYNPDETSANKLIGPKFYMYGGEIAGNKGGGYGSAILASSSNKALTALNMPAEHVPAEVNIYGGKIYENSIVPGTATANRGGGTIYAITDTKVNIQGGEFYSNSTTSYGGLLWLAEKATLNISGGNFHDNTATGHASAKGGLIYNTSAGTATVPAVTITGGTFTGNKSKSNGGWMYTNAGTVVVTGTEENPVIISANETTGNVSGGAFFLETPSTATFTYTNFTDNISKSAGGAIYAKDSLTLNNCVLSGNKSTSAGSAIRQVDNSNTPVLTLNNTRITNNWAGTSGAAADKCGAVALSADTTKTILSGVTVIDANKNGTEGTDYVLAQDLVFLTAMTPKIYVNQLADGSRVSMYSMNADGITEATALVEVAENGQQTEWDCGRLTYAESTNTKTSGGYTTVTPKDISWDENNQFIFGHYHSGVAYQPWGTGTSLPTATDKYYLTTDVTLSATWIPASDTILCTNGHTIQAASDFVGAGIKPAAGSAFSMIDCTAYYDENGHLIKGGLFKDFSTNASSTAPITLAAGNNSSATVYRFSGIEFKNCANIKTRYNDTATTFYEGGTIWAKDNMNLTIDGCKFTECNSVTEGGALVIRSNNVDPTSVTVQNTVFENNTGNRYGGAVALYGKSTAANPVVRFDNCLFKNNTVRPLLTAENATTIKASTGLGGAIYTRTFNIAITDTVFEGNKAEKLENVTEVDTTVQGGAVYVYDGTCTFGSAEETDSVTFRENQSGNYGGAIFNNKSTLSIYNTEFNGNTAVVRGGAICNSTDATLTVGAAGDTNRVEFIGNSSGNRGGAIATYAANKTVTITNTLFQENEASTGGAVEMRALNSSADRTYTVNFVDCDFVGNTATTEGGAILVTGDTTTNTKKVTVNANVKDGCVFDGNSAPIGGAIAVNAYRKTQKSGTAATNYYNLTVENGCEFKNNTATTRGGAIGTTVTISSGAISNSGIANVTIQKGTDGTACVFTNNAAPDGGAIALWARDTGDNNHTQNMYISGATFDGNKAVTGNARGGAILLNGSAKLQTCQDNIFTNNQAGNGGAIHTGAASASSLNALNCQFTNNEATGTGAGGAVLVNFAGTVEFGNCTFTGNSAYSGGAIRVNGNSSLATMNIGYDVTETDDETGEETTTTYGCTFTGNTATNKGGAVSVMTTGTYYTESTKIQYSTFTGNSGELGSAVYLGTTSSSEETTNAQINSCTISGNTSSDTGAVYVDNANANLSLAGKTVIKSNTGDTFAKADLVFTKITGDTQPVVDATGLTAGAEIGINATDDRYANDPVVGTVTDTAANAYFFSNNENFVPGVVDSTSLKLVKHVANDVAYETVQDAIAAETSDTFKLQASTPEEIDLPDGVTTIDLDGKDIAKVTVPNEKTLTLIDSATNDYDISDGVYGKVTVEGEVNTYGVVNNGGTKRYLVIENDDGSVSAHRVYMAINSRLLRPYTNGAGFRASFTGDQIVADNVEFGIQLWGETNNWDGSKIQATFDGMVPGLQKDEYGVTITTPNQKTVAIFDAITAEDKTNWEDTLYAEPIMILDGVTYVGAKQSLVMRTMAEKALNNVPMNSETYEYIMNMIEQFELEYTEPAAS